MCKGYRGPAGFAGFGVGEFRAVVLSAIAMNWSLRVYGIY